MVSDFTIVAIINYKLLMQSMKHIQKFTPTTYSDRLTSSRYFEDNSTAESDRSVDTGHISGINSTTHAVRIVERWVGLPAYLSPTIPIHVITVVEKDSIRVCSISDKDALKPVSENLQKDNYYYGATVTL